MSNEEDTEQIVDLTLVPVGTVVESCDRWDWLGLVRVGLDSYPGVMAHREQVINDLESLIPAWKVDSGDIGDGGELSSCVVPAEVLAISLTSFTSVLGPSTTPELAAYLSHVKTGMTPDGGI